ncbi:hypothetical protein ACFQ77_06475 [Streptomyces virginiae]|uniref:hypothetical protein n=1 Tax=Streptomyces virginiae TaxID=1961 RepID=UPI0036C5414C
MGEFSGSVCDPTLTFAGHCPARAVPRHADGSYPPARRAELYAYAPDPMVSPRSVLDADPGLPERWWKEMTSALDALNDVPPPTDREAVREEFLRRVHPPVHRPPGRRRHLDYCPRRPPVRQHHPGPLILDWEGWGRAPYGYDAATVYVYALPTPVLDRPEARTGLLSVCAQILQAQGRIDFYAELADPVREHLAHL